MKYTTFLLFVTVMVSLPFASTKAQDTKFERGAHLYLERCALCHGSKGLGEGPLALLVRNYPDTNLKTSNNPDQSISEVIEHGNSMDLQKSLSPPWRDELTSADIAAVAAFV